MSVKLRKRKLASGKVQLYLDMYQCGSRRCESLGMFLEGDRLQDRQVWRLAEVIRARRELDLHAEFHGVKIAYNGRENFVEYYRKVADQKPAANTRRIYGEALAHLIKFGGERIIFAHLSNSFFERFKSYLLGKVSANTTYMYFLRVKTVLAQAVRDNMMAVNPAADVRLRKPERFPVFLTLEEVKKLFDTECSNDHVKAAFLFSCFTGLRYSDLVCLRWENIRDGHIEFTQVKTGNRERLPLGVEAKKILEGQKSTERSNAIRKEHNPDCVFFMPDQSVADRGLKRWGVAAGLDKRISFHKARHTFATLSLAAGVDIFTTSKLLGHKHVQTTEIYAHVMDEQKQKAVAMLPTL